MISQLHELHVQKHCRCPSSDAVEYSQCLHFIYSKETINFQDCATCWDIKVRGRKKCCTAWCSP
jgi:hypothetical protein